MSRIWQFFCTDVWRKLLALVFACGFYWLIYMDNQKHTSIEVPLQLEVSSGLYVPQNLNLNVKLTVKGSDNRLSELKSSGLVGKVTVDESIVSSDGKYRIKLKPDYFNVGFFVKIVDIDPGVIALPVQKKISKDIPVRAVKYGEPLKGYLLNALYASPDTVKVTGPEYDVNMLREIRTDDLSVNFDTTFVKVKNLINPDPEKFKLSLNTVTLKAEIIPLQEIPKKFSAVPVNILSDPATVENIGIESIMPAKVNVTVSGPVKEIDKITRQNVRVFIDLSSVKTERGKHKIALQGRLIGVAEDNKLRVTAISPSEVEVSVKNIVKKQK